MTHSELSLDAIIGYNSLWFKMLRQEFKVVGLAMTYIEDAQSFKTVKSCGLQSRIVIPLQLEDVWSLTQFTKYAFGSDDSISWEQLVATILMSTEPRRDKARIQTVHATNKTKNSYPNNS